MAAPAGDSGGSSPLSNMDSDVDYDEYYQQEQEQEHEQEQEQEAQAPPAKRPRLSMNPNSRRGTPVSHRSEPDHGSISSDTEGDVPNSPGMSRLDDEEGHHEQVTICSWDGCDRGDCGDMDQLVAHIHADHIEGRGKKYTCEWSDCSRKSYPHASAYALKAHMRSHTREKPFFCTLPECDRSFTRSDALAKHMRTVHETEALRPSDPVPKSITTSKQTNRLKLINLAPKGSEPTESMSPGQSTAASPIYHTVDGHIQLTEEQGFTPEELALSPRDLLKLCKMQLRWAEEENQRVMAELDVLKELKDKEWLEKEILLDQVIKNEMAWAERRMIASATTPSVEQLRADARRGSRDLSGIKEEIASASMAGMSEPYHSGLEEQS